MRNSTVGILPLISHDVQKDRANNEIAIEIMCLGKYLLRGAEDLKGVYQVMFFAFQNKAHFVYFRRGCCRWLEWMMKLEQV